MDTNATVCEMRIEILGRELLAPVAGRIVELDSATGKVMIDAGEDYALTMEFFSEAGFEEPSWQITAGESVVKGDLLCVASARSKRLTRRFVTMRLDLASNCEKVIELESGKVTAGEKIIAVV